MDLLLAQKLGEDVHLLHEMLLEHCLTYFPETVRKTPRNVTKYEFYILVNRLQDLGGSKRKTALKLLRALLQALYRPIWEGIHVLSKRFVEYLLVVEYCSVSQRVSRFCLALGALGSEQAKLYALVTSLALSDARSLRQKGVVTERHLREVSHV